MLKFKNNRIIYETNGDDVVIISNTTKEKFEGFEAHLKKIYGCIPNLINIRYEVIYFFLKLVK